MDSKAQSPSPTPVKKAKSNLKNQHPRIYTQYDPPPKPTTVCPPEDNRTQSKFYRETEINSILGRYAKTGILGKGPGLGSTPPQFGDFTNGSDYHDSQNKIQSAQQAFQGLPSHLRNHFDNDPGKLLEFIGDPENRDEAVSLGLIEQPEKSDKKPNDTGNGKTVSNKHILKENKPNEAEKADAQ